MFKKLLNKDINVSLFNETIIVPKGTTVSIVKFIKDTNILFVKVLETNLSEKLNELEITKEDID